MISSDLRSRRAIGVMSLFIFATDTDPASSNEREPIIETHPEGRLKQIGIDYSEITRNKSATIDAAAIYGKNKPAQDYAKSGLLRTCEVRIVIHLVHDYSVLVFYSWQS
jgi:hypothetical protein